MQYIFKSRGFILLFFIEMRGDYVFHLLTSSKLQISNNISLIYLYLFSTDKLIISRRNYCSNQNVSNSHQLKFVQDIYIQRCNHLFLCTKLFSFIITPKKCPLQFSCVFIIEIMSPFPFRLFNNRKSVLHDKSQMNK